MAIQPSNATLSILQRVTEFFTTQTEIVRKAARTFTRHWAGIWREPINDWGRSNYLFWRRAYHAQVKGIELSGLFIRPVVSKIAGWSLGTGPEWVFENKASQAAFDLWYQQHHSQIAAAWEAALKVGDAFLVVNADLSITLVAPEYVEPIVDPADYSRIIGWRISQVMQHPQEVRRMMVIDEYYEDRRVQRVDIDGLPGGERVYPNLIGIVPVLHIANQPDEGHTFGYAEADSALNALYRYNDVILAAVQGNIMQGRPTPTLNFKNRQDLNDFWTRYGEYENTELPDGTIQRNETLSIDLSQIMTYADADFKYAVPGSFGGDVQIILGLIFYLLLEHWQVPEFVFGNAIASSQASAETQMPVWEAFLQSRQTQMRVWLIQLSQIVLGYLSLFEPGVSTETPAVQFRKLTQDGKLTLETLAWLYEQGLIDERTAVTLAPVEIENIDQVLAQAKVEREAREAKAQAAEDAAFARDRDAEIEQLEREPEPATESE